MKAFTCGLGSVVIVVGLLSAMGCESSNESNANRAAETVTNPGAPAGKAAEAAPPPKSMDEYKNQQAGKGTIGEAYPGAAKKK